MGMFVSVLTALRAHSPVMWNNEMYFATQIFDHVANVQYDVFAQEDLVNCFSHSINGTIPRPNLSPFQYIGKAAVGYVRPLAAFCRILVLILCRRLPTTGPTWRLVR